MALLVINASSGEFESGLRGQTREHIVLARSLGVGRLIVAVNQLENVGWAPERLAGIERELTPLLQQAGFRSPPPVFVPISALCAVNLAPGPPLPPELAWYTGRSLLEEIDQYEASARQPPVGTRLCVNDVFRSASLGGLSVSGTLQAGTLLVGQRLLVLPGREPVTIKGLQSRGASARRATAGDHVELSIAVSSDAVVVEAGSVLCDQRNPARVARRVEVLLRTLQPATPLTKGQPFELYCHVSSCSATLHKIVCGIDKAGQRTQSRPRHLLSNSGAVVQLELDKPLCVELHSECRQMGRVVLREAGQTLAAGVVTAIVR